MLYTWLGSYIIPGGGFGEVMAVVHNRMCTRAVGRKLLDCMYTVASIETGTNSCQNTFLKFYNNFFLRIRVDNRNNRLLCFRHDMITESDITPCLKQS